MSTESQKPTQNGLCFSGLKTLVLLRLVNMLPPFRDHGLNGLAPVLIYFWFFKWR